MNTLKEWIEHYDFINGARWGDDDKEPPTWEYWNAYVTSMIIHYARDEVHKCPA